jgi:hypothetical protein
VDARFRARVLWSTDCAEVDAASRSSISWVPVPLECLASRTAATKGFGLMQFKKARVATALSVQAPSACANIVFVHSSKWGV